MSDSDDAPQAAPVAKRSRALGAFFRGLDRDELCLYKCKLKLGVARVALRLPGEGTTRMGYFAQRLLVSKQKVGPRVLPRLWS